MFSKKDIEKYFNSEKAESWVFMAIGFAGILLAAFCFLFLQADLYKGMGIPLAAVGLLMGMVGFTIYKRSDADRIRIVHAYDMNPSYIINTELPRMKKVMKSFVTYRWLEIILFATGAAMYIYFIRDFRQDFWRGFGFALAIMALLALVADYFAEKRGHVYLKGLESFTSKIS